MSEVEFLLKNLSNKPGYLDGNYCRNGIKTRVKNLFDTLGELNNNNPVAVLVRSHWNFIERTLEGETTEPLEIETDLTTFCSSHCFFCNEGLEKRRAEFPLKMFKANLDDFSEKLSIPQLNLSGGGDPTDSSMFGEAVKYAKQKGFRTYCSTHGGIVGTNRLPIELFTENLDILKFSIASPDSQTYNNIQNRGFEVQPGELQSVDYIFDQISKISKSRREEVIMGEPVKLPRVFVAMTINSLNQHQILNMAKRCQESGVDTLLLRPVLFQDETVDQIDEGIRQMRVAKKLFINSPLEVLTFEFRRKDIRDLDFFERCFTAFPIVSPASSDSLTIGSVTPCCLRRGNHSENEWLNAGDPRIQPLAEIITSERYKKSLQAQNANLHNDRNQICAGCRLRPPNVLIDILLQANPEERQIIRQIILTNYPRNPLSEIMKGFV